MSTTRPFLPAWTVVVHTKEQTSIWLGTAYYFFDIEEEASAFYQAQCDKGLGVVKRPFYLGNDVKYMNVCEQVRIHEALKKGDVNASSS